MSGQKEERVPGPGVMMPTPQKRGGRREADHSEGDFWDLASKEFAFCAFIGPLVGQIY